MIRLKSAEDIENLRVSGRILRETFQYIEPHLSVGISTWEIDRLADEYIRSQGATPAFYKYTGFPGHVCISVNEVVIHGIPSKQRILQDGDIVGVDMGVNYKDFFTDSAKTYGIGRISDKNKQLLRVTEESLLGAIDNLTPHSRIKEVGKFITNFVKPYRYGIVDNFCGHGVGFAVHEEPLIFNCYPSSGPNIRFRPGMVIAIEPMICQGTHKVKQLDDGFTIVTVDGKNAAHFEHTIAILEDCLEILT